MFGFFKIHVSSYVDTWWALTLVCISLVPIIQWVIIAEVLYFFVRNTVFADYWGAQPVLLKQWGAEYWWHNVVWMVLIQRKWYCSAQPVLLCRCGNDTWSPDHLITSGFPKKWGAPALDLLLVIKPDKVKDYNAQWFQNIGLLWLLQVKKAGPQIGDHTGGRTLKSPPRDYQ